MELFATVFSNGLHKLAKNAINRKHDNKNSACYEAKSQQERLLWYAMHQKAWESPETDKLRGNSTSQKDDPDCGFS